MRGCASTCACSRVWRTDRGVTERCGRVTPWRAPWRLRHLANVDLVVAQDPRVGLGPRLRVRERRHLDDREAGDQLLRFGERAVVPAACARGHLGPCALATRTQRA